MPDQCRAFLPARWAGAKAISLYLKVYIADIATHQNAVDGKSLEKHNLIIRFSPLVTSWDLSGVLTALQSAPLEPLQSVELKFLSVKTVILVALASIKRVGYLSTFSIDKACLEFVPANSHLILRPRSGCVPKVLTTPFRDQVVNLQALPLEEADPALALFCPVRTLRACEKALSKQKLSHWLVDTIAWHTSRKVNRSPLVGRPTPLGMWLSLGL